MSAALAMSSLERSYGKGRQYFEGIVSFLDSRKGSEMNLSELERELKKRGLELMRQLLQEHVDSRSPGLCVEPVVGADGVERLQIRPQERKVETIFGTVEESRAGYGQKGVKSLHPLDGELNIATNGQKWTRFSDFMDPCESCWFLRSGQEGTGLKSQPWYR